MKNNAIIAVIAVFVCILHSTIHAQSNVWTTDGNTSMDSLDYLGTNDSTGLNFKTNAASRLYIDPDGNIGIGTTLPTTKLDLNSGGIRVQDYAGSGMRVMAVDSSGNLVPTDIGLKSGGGNSCNPVLDGWGIGTTTPTTLHLCGPYDRVQVGEQGIVNYNNLGNMLLDVHGDLRVGGEASLNSLAGGNGLHVVFADQYGKLSLHPSVGMDPFWGSFGTQVQPGMFLGSTNNEDLHFKTNNTTRMTISGVGKLTIPNLAGGPLSPFEPVMVDASGTLLRGSGGALWSTSGNTGASGQVLGTVTNDPLKFVTGGATKVRMEIGASGEVAINCPLDTDKMLQVNGHQGYGAAIRATADATSGTQRPICFEASLNTDGTKAFSVFNRAMNGNGCNGEEVFRVWGDGRVEAKRVKVFVNGWCDHVFEKSYELRPLEAVDAYIRANGHLPEIPSTTEVMRDGVDVGSMEALLLMKVEELTLYAIEQQQRCVALEQQIEELKTNIEKK